MKPIFLNQSNSSDEFLYIQIYEVVKQRILSGELTSGEKLPSLRLLAADLGISVTTVELAYSQLLVEGYVTSKAKSGYYVAGIAPAARAAADGLAGGGRHLPTADGVRPAGAAEGGSPQAACQADRKASHDLLNCTDELSSLRFSLRPSQYITDPGCFDFVKWKKCAARVFNEYSELLLFESDPQGEEALRFEISKYLYTSRAVTAGPERIVIGAGTQQITGHLSRILLKMGISLVSLESPGYLPVQSKFQDAGFTVSHIPVVSDGIDIGRLPTNLRSAAYVSPSNQFPTGAVMPIGRRQAILDWAAENDSIIIEDDYDSELRYFGKPVPALQGLDKFGCVVYLGSFSSTLFPAVKISYMVLPENMAEIFRQIKHQYTQTCSKAEQLTLAFFMEGGYYYTGIRRLRKLYAQKLQTALTAFSQYAKGFVSPVNTHSGINLTLKVRSRKKAEQLCEEAKSLGLQLVPLSEITDQESSALNFYYSQLPLSQIDELVKKLTELWKRE